MKFLGHPISMEDTKRRYLRGYYHGRKNTPLSMCKHDNSQAFCRGWGAGQAFLHKATDAWPAEPKTP